MGIKLIATDMDGTLLDSQKRLPEDFGLWVKSHTDIKVVIASGRQFFALRRDLSDLEEYLVFIAENGGLVFDQGEIIYCDQMNVECVRECAAIFKTMDGVSPIACGAESAYIIKPTDEELDNARMYYAHLKVVSDIEEALACDTIVKLALFVHNYKAEEKLPVFDGLKDRVDVVLSGTSWIDFANYSANKGSAMSAIMEKYGVDKSEAMAFGDYLNDYSLLQCCEESYCMENGRPELKAIAKHIAKSNDEDGVMEVLRSL